jgi:hypothetical protein
MTFEQLLELLAVGSIVVLPALAVTMRMALKPIVDAILRLSEGLKGSQAQGGQGGDPAALERANEEIGELRRRLAELQKAEQFYQRLIGSPPVSDQEGQADVGYGERPNPKEGDGAVDGSEPPGR